MLKIVLILWILGPEGDVLESRFEGFYDMKACETAAESLTEPNPQDDWSPGFAARCVELPK